jgi:hypothetical protein
MLENYMFTDDKLKSFSPLPKEREKEKNPKQEKPAQEKTIVKKRVFNDADTLFWCYYEMKNGVGSYDLIEKKTIVTEKQMKIALVERLREATLLHKFAALTHVESKLANDRAIDINTFLTLCVLDELNIVFINKRTYYELILNSDRPIHYVCKLDYKYGMDFSANLDEIRTTFYKVDNIDKPIKAISAYKLDELVDMHQRISGGDDSVKKKKADLYEAIMKKLNL